MGLKSALKLIIGIKVQFGFNGKIKVNKKATFLWLVCLFISVIE